MDLLNQTNRVIVEQIDDLYNVWQWLVENLVIPKIANIIHKQIVNVARMPPMLVHLLPDQIQHHLDLKMEEVYEIDLRKTKKHKIKLEKT